MKRPLLTVLLVCISFISFADTGCGPFTINWKAQDGLARINGQKPETQKIIFLKQEGD